MCPRGSKVVIDYNLVAIYALTFGVVSSKAIFACVSTALCADILLEELLICL